MTDVQRPPTLTLRSRTGAAKPTLWPTLNPCHFTVPCFIFKTKTFSFSSKQALSNDVLSVKIGRTTTLRRLFKVINFGRSKFVCTLWPCPVFGMRAAGLATHLTTPVCPVARTQTMQVVYCIMQIIPGPHASATVQATVTSPPKLVSFSRSRPPACVRARWLSEVLLNRAFSAVRCCFCRGVSLTLARTSLEMARCASRGSAASACHPFASRDPIISCSVGEKVQYKPQNLLLASIKPPWKFKAFHKV